MSKNLQKYLVVKKKYKIVLTNENPDIAINVYEGNNDLVEKNKFLATIYFNNLNKTGEIIYTVKFTVDVNSKLTINLIAESLGIEKEEEIKNITHALADSSTKKIKILKTKVLTPMISINAMLNTNINNLKASRTDEEKIKNLNICIKIQEDKVNNYVVFLKDNETAYEYVYTSTKELFNFYIDLFKLKKSASKYRRSYLKNKRIHEKFSFSNWIFIRFITHVYRNKKIRM